MKIFFGSDHAGFELKGKLIPFVQSLGYEAIDKGPFSYDPNDDYTEYTIPVAKEVSADKEAKGIIIGGSGQGEAIAANRHKGIRTTVYYGLEPDVLRLGRDHNDANVLSLGARLMSEQEAKDAVKLWLETPFSNAPRHMRRLKRIEELS